MIVSFVKNGNEKFVYGVESNTVDDILDNDDISKIVWDDFLKFFKEWLVSKELNLNQMSGEDFKKIYNTLGQMIREYNKLSMTDCIKIFVLHKYGKDLCDLLIKGEHESYINLENDVYEVLEYLSKHYDKGLAKVLVDSNIYEFFNTDCYIEDLENKGILIFHENSYIVNKNNIDSIIDEPLKLIYSEKNIYKPGDEITIGLDWVLKDYFDVSWGITPIYSVIHYSNVFTKEDLAKLVLENYKIPEHLYKYFPSTFPDDSLISNTEKLTNMGYVTVMWA